jgi:hypothetical protein
MTTFLIILAYIIGGVVSYLAFRGNLHKEGKWRVKDRAAGIFYSLIWPVILVLFIPFAIVDSLENKSPAKW